MGSVSYSVSHAVRSADENELAMLDAWLPTYFDALVRRDRLFAARGGWSTNELRALIVAVIALAESSPATRMLSETTARARKLASAMRSRLYGQMSEGIAKLESHPEDTACWNTLRGCQQSCAEAPLSDPARELNDWTMLEWWTPALAAERRLSFECSGLRHAARGKALGSDPHAALRAFEDAIADCWRQHLGLSGRTRRRLSWRCWDMQKPSSRWW